MKDVEHYACNYIGNRLANIPFDSNESMQIILNIGLNMTNIRNFLAIKVPYEPISMKEYTWNDVYSKKSIIKINEYIRNEINKMNEIFDEKCRLTVEKIESFLIDTFNTYENKDSLCALLNSSNPNGFYQQLVAQGMIDYSDLERDSVTVLEKIKTMDTENYKIHFHKEERIADIFSDVDVFLNQKYEILRYKTIEKIYQKIYEIILKNDCYCPEGEVTDEYQEIFDENHIFDMFVKRFAQIFDRKTVIEEITSQIEDILFVDDSQPQEEISSSNYEEPIISLNNEKPNSQPQEEISSSSYEESIIPLQDEKDGFHLPEENRPSESYEDSTISEKANESNEKLDLIIHAIQNGVIKMTSHYALLAEYQEVEIDSNPDKLLTICISSIDKVKALKKEAPFYTCLKVQNNTDYDTLLKNAIFMERLHNSYTMYEKLDSTLKSLEKMLWEENK